jgi:CheY-like chemotaxis protein
MKQKQLLLVDDNPNYREAFRRSLELEGYCVLEAENSGDAYRILSESEVQVVITDLDMTHRTEGLDLIRECKRHFPLLPIILISAVGTFDEGALAQQYGASAVLSKSRIQEESAHFNAHLIKVIENRARVEKSLAKAEAATSDESAKAAVRTELMGMLSEASLDSGSKGRIYEAVLFLEAAPELQQSRSASFSEAEARLLQELPEYKSLTDDTKEMICLADDLYFRQERDENVSISRNIGFSFTFAVESEIKHRITKKIVRFLSDKAGGRLLDAMFDSSMHGLDLFFNQYVMQETRQLGEDLNADITRQVLNKIRELKSRYKADGLKALGVIVFIFGRQYTFTNRNGKVPVNNPLGLRGLSEEEALRLADNLVRLQHLRNPYVHPEFTEREKASKLRETALACLNLITQLH